MTKKHYIAIAAGFAAQLKSTESIRPDARDDWQSAILRCARMFADIAEDDNGSFDRARFLTACGF